MSDRLTDIVTRTGDDGRTGLADGRRLSKANPRIEALGVVDELNSQIGVLLAEPLDADLYGLLREIQNDLFDLGAELAWPEGPVLEAAALARLDAAIGAYNAELGPLREFILPGGTRSAALAHVCRSMCRRAERRLVALAEVELLAPRGIQYLNRLSDLLFVLARSINRRAGVLEVHWRGPRPA